MVHTRINERKINPNPHINFIRALAAPGAGHATHIQEDSDAKEMLRALAAQLRPVMKRHGFTVNSFEEYESNKVFLGRNWNNGETIELVLRDGCGRFYPASRLLGVFCHELAHIKHMNHSGAFHALRRQISSEVRTLQLQGYFGDGYWSAGTRLADSERISGEEVRTQELPEYTCGGAHAQSRSSALPSSRRHRARKVAGPSLSSGAQTAKQRKAGSRLTSKGAFDAAGEGSVLDEHVDKGGKGSGFRKQAGSRRAREERALAAERRLRAMQGTAQESVLGHTGCEGESEGESEDEENMAETDGDRLRMMRDVMGEDDLKAMRDEDDDDIVITCDPEAASTGSPGREGKHKLVGDSDDDNAPSKKAKREERGPTSVGGSAVQGALQKIEGGSFPTRQSWSSPSQPPGRNILREKVRQRKSEALGMDLPRTVGNAAGPARDTDHGNWACDTCTFMNASDGRACEVCEQPRREGDKGGWRCLACTFVNGAVNSRCEMCDLPRVE